MGHPFAKTMRDALTSWLNDGSGADSLKGLLAPDVVWHMAGTEEPLRGRETVLEALSSDMAAIEVTGEVHAVLADDEHAIALVRVNITRADRSVSYGASEIVHHEDGLITERWTMVDDFPAMAAFWAD